MSENRQLLAGPAGSCLPSGFRVIDADAFRINEIRQELPPGSAC
jgi:hypothetical protein